MNRSKRIPSVILAAVGLAVLAAPFAGAAQEIDNRPIYYLMLKSLEDGFQAYNIALAAELKARGAALRGQFESRRLEVAKEFEALEAQRARRESAFEAEREALNERIASSDEQIALRDVRIGEEQRIEKHDAARYANDPRIKVLEQQIATQLADIDAIRTRYRTQSAATQKARAALTGQIEEYMNAGDPLALELRSLDQDWQRFADSERRKLEQLANAYAVDYAAYDTWLGQQRVALEEAKARVASALATDRQQRALHAATETELRALIAEYNALVAVHDKAGANDPGRDQRALKFAALEKRIAALQAQLASAREAVLKVNEDLAKGNEGLSERYQRFAAEKRRKETALAADLAAFNAARPTVEAAIDARRQRVDAQIKALEAKISVELQDARGSLETSSARLSEQFGRGYEGFDTAITRVLEENDDGLLYTSTGAPRFDLSGPLTAAAYTALERVIAERREIDARIVAIENSQGGAQPTSAGEATAAAALERERAALSAERQKLLEARTAFAREYRAQAAVLEERQRAIDARFADERALLRELYSARASLTRSEMQTVQGVLVAAVKGVPGTDTDNSDHAQLMIALQAKAGQMNAPVDESLLAPHALMNQIASQLPDGEAGSYSGGWRPFLSRKVTASRQLTGAEKAALASAWLARLRRQPRFIDIANELGASGAVMDGGQALSSLFMAGVLGQTAITEQRLDDGGFGIQVSVLGRAYQLDANGSLERLPSG
ncbi:MAG: hypothetical protein BMS9Abin14_044 [Gammaproteobacteria bacterium]|nr:MAG: hypothetical protein BMS9Abin14_044 [Gammaproteobacteria bacterium]